MRVSLFANDENISSIFLKFLKFSDTLDIINLTITTPEINTFLQTAFPDTSNEALGQIIRGRMNIILSNVNAERDLIEVLSSRHEALFERLRDLSGNSFHNLEHHLEVHGRLGFLLQHLKRKDEISQIDRICMLEAALRHDDGHVGHMHRQHVEK